MKRLILSAAMAALLTACNGPESKTAALPPVSDMGLADPFVSDVIDVHAQHLDEAFWTSKASQTVIMTPEQIEQFNAKNTAMDPKLYDISQLPESMSAQELTAAVRSISNIPSYPRIYADGTEVTPEDFARYEAMLNLDAAAPQNPVRYALAVRRTPLRLYPTLDTVFSHDADNLDIDRFQESALFPGEAAAVLHTSADGKWALIQNYNYIAWVQMADIAIGPRAEVLTYADMDGGDFLLITGAKVFTVFNPEVPAVSELQLDMGVRLPLSRPKELASNLHGQNPYLSHMVRLPVRTDDGGLAFEHALIQRNQDVSIGYLPYTEVNIIHQAFKFLGERYGWGQRYNGRDCTGFVGEVYKTFGIRLPRNSIDQAKSDLGQNIRYDETAKTDTKAQDIRGAQIGDLVYIPGHVLMKIGTADGQPFVMHDVTGLTYKKPDGTLYKGRLNGVSLTPILPLHVSSGKSYVDLTTTIMSVRP